jgi:hypothetical protein
MKTTSDGLFDVWAKAHDVVTALFWAALELQAYEQAAIKAKAVKKPSKRAKGAKKSRAK